MNKTTDSQKKATKKWAEKNREHSNYLKYRSCANTFINNSATLEDLEDLTKIILQKTIELMKNRRYK